MKKFIICIFAFTSLSCFADTIHCDFQSRDGEGYFSKDPINFRIFNDQLVEMDYLFGSTIRFEKNIDNQFRYFKIKKMNSRKLILIYKNSHNKDVYRLNLKTGELIISEYESHSILFNDHLIPITDSISYVGSSSYHCEII
jgi:hypothetical protein